MNVTMKIKRVWVSIILLLLGIIAIVMENILYGYVDQNGVLQESFFLPLGVISLLLGVSGLFVKITRFYLKKYRT